MSTISTVGYGDIVPHSFRPAFAVFFLVAVVLFTYVLGESVALITEIGKYRRLENLFAEGLSPQILDRMDHFRDGQVRHVLVTSIEPSNPPLNFPRIPNVPNPQHSAPCWPFGRIAACHDPPRWQSRPQTQSSPQQVHPSSRPRQQTSIPGAPRPLSPARVHRRP